MIMNKNEIINKLVPGFLDGIADENTKKLFSKYADLEGENANYGDLLDMGQNIVDLMKQIKNYDEISTKFIKLMNTPVPRMWDERYHNFAVRWLKYQNFEFDNQKEIEALLSTFDKNIIKNENTFNAIADTGIEISTDLWVKKTDDMLNTFKECTDEEMSNMMEKIPIKLKNVKLYHGTSYENYLKIKNDGCIRATDYSEGNYPNENAEKLYKNENGFVFTSDSMDFPFLFCFGGYREHTIGWAYDKSEKKDIYNSIGVVFEIDPDPYEVFYYNKKDGHGAEFLIKGNVDLKDTKARFFKWDINFSEMTEEEIKKRLKQDDICNE